ncbi:MAG: RNA ligase family protein [Candidatus Saccharimonadales bacterium]
MAQPYRPMQPTKTESLPAGSEWVYEPKLDGYRMLAYTSLRRIVLRTRYGNNFTDRYPLVVQQLPAALGGREAVLDGEMVGFDESGQHNIRILQRKTARVVYFVFDLLAIDDVPVINRRWEDRHGLLEEMFKRQPNVDLCPYFDDRDAVLQATEKLNMEGVVAKKTQSIYKPGKRSKDWLKFKFQPHQGRAWRR